MKELTHFRLLPKFPHSNQLSLEDIAFDNDHEVIAVDGCFLEEN